MGITEEELSKIQDPWVLLKTAMMDPAGLQNPYPLLRRLHDFGEAVETPDGVVVVFGYDRVNELMRSPLFIKRTESVPSPVFAVANEDEMKELREVADREPPFLVFLNAPDHARIRGVASRGFLPRLLSALRSTIEVHVDRLLADIDPGRPADIIGSFSALLAPEIVGELIGLPSEHRALVASQTARLMRGMDPGASFALRLDSARARCEQADYVREVIADRRRRPRDDFITILVEEAETKGVMNDAELTALVQILYIGGYETTSHMIGNGLVALLHNPDQFALLRDDPSLMSAAIDEMLRFDGPISLTSVEALDGAHLGGEAARPGVRHIGLLAAANHDPKAFDHPERFDIRRPRKTHVAFGGGPHFCVGSALARLELDVVFTVLLQRFPNMRLVDEPLVRVAAFHQRAYEAVRVVLEPS